MHQTHNSFSDLKIDISDGATKILLDLSRTVGHVRLLLLQSVLLLSLVFLKQVKQ